MLLRESNLVFMQIFPFCFIKPKLSQSSDSSPSEVLLCGCAHVYNYKLKRLGSSLLIFCTQNKRFKGGLAVVSFPSSWFEAKIKLWEPNFCCSALKCVEAQQLNVGPFFVVILSDQER